MEYILPNKQISEKYSDVQISTFDQSSQKLDISHAHRIVLATHSKFFEMVFEHTAQNGVVHIHLDISTKSWQQIQELLYTKHVIIEDEDVPSFRKALLSLKLKVSTTDSENIIFKEETSSVRKKTGQQQTIKPPVQSLSPEHHESLDMPIPFPASSTADIPKSSSSKIFDKQETIFSDEKPKFLKRTSPEPQKPFIDAFHKKIKPDDKKAVRFQKQDVDEVSETTVDDNELRNISFSTKQKGNKNVYQCNMCPFMCDVFFDANSHFQSEHMQYEKQKSQLQIIKLFQAQTEEYLKTKFKEDKSDEVIKELNKKSSEMQQKIIILQGLGDHLLTYNQQVKKNTLISWFKRKCDTIASKINENKV